MAATKSKTRKNYEEGRVYIRAKFNNTIVTLTDTEGKVLAWCSPGAKGFKGARQSTPYAGQVSAEEVAEKALGFGMKSVSVFVKGIGPAREQTIRGLMNKDIEILSLTEESRIPHGGCRPKRQRKP